MTAPQAPTPPTPIPVRCPECGKRMEANVAPGGIAEWKCRGCLKWVKVKVPEAA